MADKPTDEALENLFVEETGFDIDDFPAAIFDFARAVLAKWGQPARAAEPVAYLTRNADGDPAMLFFDKDEASTYCEDGVDPEPLFTPHQPTQAQAGAVPLTDEQLAEIMRETWGCASIAPRHAMQFARAIERAHDIGIKGGQHG